MYACQLEPARPLSGHRSHCSPASEFSHRRSELGARLGGADLRDANVQGANVQGANLRDANLRDADLRRANLEGTRNAELQGARLK
jgi:uncharacterized protein YjbI with pentapeptide repeats